jgi:hypothetical protein
METARALALLAYDNSSLIFGTLLGIISIASLFISGTKTPAPDTFVGKLYRGVEYLALTFGKAKDTGTKAE